MTSLAAKPAVFKARELSQPAFFPDFAPFAFLVLEAAEAGGPKRKQK